MVPAGEITGQAVRDLAGHMEPDDVVIDGSNSYYRDDIARSESLSGAGIHYVDVGTSGRVWGLERGYCLMTGGPDQIVDRLRPIFEAVAPGVNAAARTPGRDGSPRRRNTATCTAAAGAGHFVKMVHNGIEYGLMAAYAEGLNILKNANAGTRAREADAETAAA